MTAFYEVLTTMASGVLIAAIVFGTLFPVSGRALRWRLHTFLLHKQPPDNAVPEPHSLLLMALILLAILGVPHPRDCNWICSAYGLASQGACAR